MSVEANKQIARDWFDAVNRGDEAGILALTTEDFVFRCMARQPEWLRYVWDRTAFAKAPEAMATVMVAPLRMTIGDITAEGDRVAIEASSEGEMLNGKRYDNAYHFLFRVRNGKIAEVREYSCSYLAQNCFGAVDPSDSGAARMADA